MLDNAAAKSLGFVPLSYEATVGPTSDWLLQVAAFGDWQKRFPVFGRYDDDPFDYHAEDEFLTGAQGQTPIKFRFGP